MNDKSETSVQDTIAEPIDAAEDTSVEPVTSNVEPAAAEHGTAIERGREAAAKVGLFATNVVDRLRNSAELAEERGRTVIANEVVEKIAGIAAREVDGVHDLGGDVSRVFASLKERMGFGEADGGAAADRGVKVRLEGTTAVIDLKIVVEFGHVVHSVTESVRAKVISSVEFMLGLEVNEVNITVDDVHVPEAPKA